MSPLNGVCSEMVPTRRHLVDRGPKDRRLLRPPSLTSLTKPNKTIQVTKYAVSVQMYDIHYKIS